MNAFNQWLADMFGPLGPLYAVGGLGVAMILFTLPFLLKKQVDPLEKLKRTDQPTSKIAKERLRVQKQNNKLEKYSSFLEPQNEQQYSEVKMKLLQAGYRSRDAVRYYHFAQFALGILGIILGVIYFIIFKASQDPTTKQTLMSILGPGGVGYMVPKYWVTKRQQARQEEITDGFPDALDMLLVCVEAGQSLDQSIVRVARELRASYPALADEFQIISHEMKAGKDKTQVLNDMGERCGVQDVASFVTVLNQAASFGTSIADALRIYAAEMRDKRVMRAEEKANKLPTKMTLTTMIFTVPPLLIILVGPSIVSIANLGSMSPN